MVGKSKSVQNKPAETTGHVWDEDITELNKPLPKWWLYTFYVSIAWAIVFCIAMPAWPTLSGFTPGVLGYSQRAVVASEIESGHAAQGSLRERLAVTPIADVKADPDLYRFAVTGGAASFATNCAPCHGRGAQGAPGYPNLNDDDWVWGGTLEDIVQTLTHGIRAADDKLTRDSAMPRFGIDKILTEDQIADAAEYVLSLSTKSGSTNTGSTTSGDPAMIARGAAVYAENCAACHGDTGAGKQDIGAPNLTDTIWLYGGTKPDVMASIRTGRGGVMPSWSKRLDPVTIKSLALYVHGLGGGK